ncbi:ComF family protein [Vibrio salinus]|uniref:ComF family protein n=1 Tax=Vibrio salinus TaxID=2899784 RepID=UPI001E370EF3|nr:phosphoribosyltransferase family protein [Vibrio salinus]MCE0493867.1 ComF family protein [Vibrio salinus]
MLAQRWKKTISQTVNRICPLCHLPLDSDDRYWCSYCLNWFRPVSRCLRCGLPMSRETRLCGQCLISPPPWHHLTCLGDYAFPLSHYIHQIKHKRQFDIIEPLARLLSERIKPESRPECLTYVPLHWRRFLVRGFNQSERLAFYLAKYHHLPLRSCFKKHRYTRPQQQLNRIQRLTNLNQTFSLSTRPDIKHIAIVDDVVTTGATLSVLCEKLLELGVETIDIYCICRTPEPD